MLSNMASSLIVNKRISTTVAKAKALRKYVEPIITKAKDNTTHSRRVVFSYLQDKDSVKELFDQIAGKVATRPGGYTRIIKTGARLGDNAETCIIELVDYNELLLSETKSASKKTSRRRRGGSKSSAANTETAETTQSTEEVKATAATAPEATATEEPKAESTDTTEENKESAE